MKKILDFIYDFFKVTVNFIIETLNFMCNFLKRIANIVNKILDYIYDFFKVIVHFIRALIIIGVFILGVWILFDILYLLEIERQCTTNLSEGCIQYARNRQVMGYN